MKYEFADDIQKRAEEIVRLMFPYIKMSNVKCFRSYGTSSRGTIARCHGLGKVFQKALNIEAHYVLEFLSERFDKFPEEEKIRIIMHELMHIPKSFGGGFKHHNFVHEKNVSAYCKEFLRRKKQTESLKNRQTILEDEKNKNQWKF